MNKPVLVYDGDCGFCAYWVRYWERMNGDRLLFTPYQVSYTDYPEITLEEFQRSIQLIEDNQHYSGAHAAFRVLAMSGRDFFLWLYSHFFLFRWFSEVSYTFTSRHRELAYGFARAIWGKERYPDEYHVVRWVFLRMLGLVYLSAFFSFGQQAEALISSQGVFPASVFFSNAYQQLGESAWWSMPSVLWLSASDSVIQWVCLTGVIASSLVMLNRFTTPMLIMCFVLYLSLVYAGQLFMFYQWDMLLLEAGFLAIFLSSGSRLIVWLYRWLIFRFMFMGGMVKVLSGDSAWHNLTALSYHYETQPLPTPIAWYLHQFPGWFHQFSTGFVLFAELVIPFLFFMPRSLRITGAVITMFLQYMIIVTGNYNFFNILAIILCLFLLDDRAMRFMVPAWLSRVIAGKVKIVKRWRKATTASFIVLVLWIVSVTGLQMYSKITGEPLQKDLKKYIASVTALKATNSYGPFAVMTKYRPEIVIEGSMDGKRWLEYEFKYKPGDLSRRPSFNIPHQPRIDWQMWFAAYSNPKTQYWLHALMHQLLVNETAVTGMLKHTPFREKPPVFVRAILYQYKFTSWNERSETGNWWKRKKLGMYIQPVSLSALSLNMR